MAHRMTNEITNLHVLANQYSLLNFHTLFVFDENHAIQMNIEYSPIHFTFRETYLINSRKIVMLFVNERSHGVSVNHILTTNYSLFRDVVPEGEYTITICYIAF